MSSETVVIVEFELACKNKPKVLQLYTSNTKFVKIGY